MIAYSTNWMGPINPSWIKKNGDYWSAGRIDVRGTDDPYGDEIGLSPMHTEDWIKLGAWLQDFKTNTMLDLNQIVQEYEKTNPPIRWFKEKNT